MLDITFIRNNPELIKEGILNKRMKMDLDELLSVDEEVRKLRTEVENLRAERNRLSKEIGQLFKDGKFSEANAAKEQTVALKEQIKNIEKINDSVKPVE